MDTSEIIILTDCGEKVMSFLQTHDETWVGKDLIDRTGVKGIYSVLQSLMNSGLVKMADPITRDFTNSKGITKPKEYKTYQLTDKGRAFIIE